MANGESELEVGRKELTLDRPPSLSNSPTSSPNSLKKDLALKHTDSLICSSPLTVNNDDILQQIKESQSADSNYSEDIDNNLNKESVKSKSEDKRVNGLIGATTENIIASGIENKAKEEETIFLEDHYSIKTPCPDSSNPNVASAPKLPANSGNQSPTKQRYFHSKNLISCLKKPKPSSESLSPTRVKRNVIYPEDNNYVKEFIEPVDPWRDVQTPSKGEVISFYKNSCQKLRTKPIEKVMKQIQDITDLSMRASTLVLRGSRMDNRSCEALESIFRRLQFENLDLENCSLEADGATALLEMIEFYHSTCKLNIACNPKIGMRGWQALCRMLRKTPCLTYLDARKTLLTDMTMPTFGRCLKADPPLKILHLEGVFLSGRPMLILTTAMKYNKILEELYLGDNDLSSSDGSPIGAMLTYNTTLQLLDLRNNQIKDVGLAHICNGLSDQSEQDHGGLCSLIMWNNGLTHEGMTYLTEGLVHTQSLKALNLGHNRIGDLGIQKLKSGLIKNKSLHKLGFLNTKLGSEGAVALAEVLADSLCITRIDIRENNIQTAGLMAFSMALKVNQSLLRLDLDKDIRKEPGMEQVMQAVLVDIYNFCFRNKQLAKQNLAQSMSSSISSSNETNAATNMVRQASTESNNDYDCIVTDDVFHPEGSKENITPFSPVFTDQNQISLKFPLQFEKRSTSDNADVNKKKQVEDRGEPNSRRQTPQTQKELISAISSSPPSLPKETGVRILNKPPANSSERRANRFSVTKILDSLGNKLANVTSMDNKSKKQPPKDEISKSAANIVLNSAVDLNATETKSNSDDKQKNSEKEIQTQTEQSGLILDCTTRILSNDDHIINSPIEIIDVREPNNTLNLTEQNSSPVMTEDSLGPLSNQQNIIIDNSVTEGLTVNGLSDLVSEATIDETQNATSSVFIAEDDSGDEDDKVDTDFPISDSTSTNAGSIISTSQQPIPIDSPL